MGKHETGYERIERDRYETPAWVVVAAGQHIRLAGTRLWEPFCGRGQMSDALFEVGAAQVYSTDIEDCGYRLFTGVYDFLSDQPAPINLTQIDGIFSNPPFGERGILAEQIIRRGLKMIEGSSRFMVLLLPVDYDAAITRAELFQNCPAFVGKIILRKRIVWFDRPVPCKPCNATGFIEGIKCLKCGGKGSKKVGPKEHHALFIWQQPLMIGRQVQQVLYAPERAA